MQNIEQQIKFEGNDYVDDHEIYRLELKRNQLGFWCGYAMRQDGQPMTDKEIDCFEQHAIGGITYQTEYVLGFDCGHSGCIVPKMPELNGPYARYVTKSECIDALMTFATHKVGV